MFFCQKIISVLRGETQELVQNYDLGPHDTGEDPGFFLKSLHSCKAQSQFIGLL